MCNTTSLNHKPHILTGLNFKYPFPPIYKLFKVIKIISVSITIFLSDAHKPTDNTSPVFQVLFLLVFLFLYRGIAGETNSDPCNQNSALECAHQAFTFVTCLYWAKMGCCKDAVPRRDTNTTLIWGGRQTSTRNAQHKLKTQKFTGSKPS